MTITELQIFLDLNCGNEVNVLEEHASWTRYGYLFIDSEDGYCYLFDKNGKMDDIKKMKTIYAKYVNKDIKKIVIPNSVESIGDWAFRDCTSLTSIKIPESVESIGYEAFRDCRSLKSIEIPESVKIIKPDVFFHYSSLKEVIFKDKTMDQVKAMNWYPWGIEDESIIKCS